MKTKRRTGADLRKVTKTLAGAGANSAKGAELAMASSRVVSKRTELGVAAIADPLQADHWELERIIPEKTKAFSASNAVLIKGLGEMAEQAAGFVINEMTIATRMTSELALCRTPAAVLGLQSRLAMEWYGRLFSQYIELAALAVRSQGAMLTPVHRAATDNARRLNAWEVDENTTLLRERRTTDRSVSIPVSRGSSRIPRLPAYCLARTDTNIRRP